MANVDELTVVYMYLFADGVVLLGLPFLYAPSTHITDTTTLIYAHCLGSIFELIFILRLGSRAIHPNHPWPDLEPHYLSLFYVLGSSVRPSCQLLEKTVSYGFRQLGSDGKRNTRRNWPNRNTAL